MIVCGVSGVDFLSDGVIFGMFGILGVFGVLVGATVVDLLMCQQPCVWTPQINFCDPINCWSSFLCVDNSWISVCQHLILLYLICVSQLPHFFHVACSCILSL